MKVAVDEFGKPIALLREHRTTRLTGLEAHKANILAARAIADTLRTSLGPRGMDKIIVSPDGQVTVTNDGATILEKMQVQHECAKLLVDLSRSQDEEVGDGTTGVVILAGALLDQALKLLDRGLHPLHIADGFEHACDVALEHLKCIATEADIYANDKEALYRAAYTALGSKVVSSCQAHLSKIAVDAILHVADPVSNDVNMDLIKIETKAGSKLEETELIDGIVLNKDFSHSQMPKCIKDAKIAILTCPFEPPKPKTKNKIEIASVEHFNKLYECEQAYFVEMVDLVAKSGANVVICQWGFDDEANHLLMKRNIAAVRWVGGVEMELVAIATGGNIVARFQDLTREKLGHAGLVQLVASGTNHDECIYIRQCANSRAVSILLRGGNQITLAEAQRCMHDAMCSVRNLLRDRRIIAGGGAAEVSAAIAVEAVAAKAVNVEQYAIKAFAQALLAIPMALADNCGLEALEITTKIKARHVAALAASSTLDKNSKSVNGAKACNVGLDCVELKIANVMDAKVYETLHSKLQQVSLATQVVKMILKIDDVMTPSEYNED